MLRIAMLIQVIDAALIFGLSFRWIQQVGVGRP
jgi:hypothetical protein